MATFDLATFPVATTVVLVASLLDSILDANKALPTSVITHFHSRAIPAISVQAYLNRILKFAPFPNEALLSVLVYFDRIAEASKGAFVINAYNVHRLLIAAIVVASKYTSDVFYPNTRYAKVGGLPLLELNQLELEFLFQCNFDLYVANEELQGYGEQLLAHASQHQIEPIYVQPANNTHLPKNRRVSSSSSPPLSSVDKSKSEKSAASNGTFKTTASIAIATKPLMLTPPNAASSFSSSSESPISVASPPPPPAPPPPGKPPFQISGAIHGGAVGVASPLSQHSSPSSRRKSVNHYHPYVVPVSSDVVGSGRISGVGAWTGSSCWSAMEE
ncbi:uncharacterized protein VTP21DRAFT_4682 [Calcarisporiella thermophila]|uniref:uncharacterized protein n=1 Tax=Calcarisporiella thermophila TaxID=911321 RepID=UPI0037427460